MKKLIVIPLVLLSIVQLLAQRLENEDENMILGHKKSLDAKGNLQ